MENLNYKPAYSYNVMTGPCPEHTGKTVDDLWNACMKHFKEPPFAIQIPDDMNEKSAELLRHRGFIVLRASQLFPSGFQR